MILLVSELMVLFDQSWNSTIFRVIHVIRK